MNWKSINLNLNTNYSDIIDYGKIEIDTTSSKLIFSIDPSHFSSFIDTSNLNFNNVFAVGIKNAEFDYYKFYSANNGQSTVSKLSVYFKHTVNDTLIIDTLNTHNIIDDLTILTPPDLVELDTTSLSVSLAKGLKSLITVDTKLWNIPDGSVFRKAELIKNNRVFFGLSALVILTLSYFLLPTIYDKGIIKSKIKN